MRKKHSEPTPTKQKRKPNRNRRSTLELAGFSRANLAVIRFIVDQSKVPFEQVLSDVVENGIITVMPMYETMIEFRKSREVKLKSLFEPRHDEPSTSEPTGPGSADEPDELVKVQYQSPGAYPSDVNGNSVDPEHGVANGSDDVVVRSRLAQRVTRLLSALTPRTSRSSWIEEDGT